MTVQRPWKSKTSLERNKAGETLTGYSPPARPEPTEGRRAAAPGQPDGGCGLLLVQGQEQTQETARGRGHCACFRDTNLYPRT